MADAEQNALSKTKSQKVHGGYVEKYTHTSATLGGLKATFNIFVPELGENEKANVLIFLSGLTCTEENFITKAGAIPHAAKHKLILVCPDTSPRGAGCKDEDDNWDFGTGAGFYVNATNEEYSKFYNMYDYVNKELITLVKENFPANKFSVTGHSMGGHGALICFLKETNTYESVSAFAPICNPSNCPWGEKCFGNYLKSKEEWAAYDATELVKAKKKAGAALQGSILIDQGSADGFLEKKQLLPEAFVSACEGTGLQLNYRLQDGYDHSYYFIQTFIQDHIDFHAKVLNA